MLALLRKDGPFEKRNCRLFVVFGTLYHARAYYPVLAILFTDLGLSLEQYVMLNVVWAAAVFLFEVPSGALADTLGRRKLLIFSAALMVIEMGVLLLAPKDGGWWLFSLCLLNRFLSGVSEASASGADEAIAYESLVEEERESAWDEVLVVAMRWRSVGFLLAMSMGGLLYDPSWWNRMVPGSLGISDAVAHRLPVAVVFVQALLCLGIALSFREVCPATGAFSERCRKAFRLTLETARMAITTRTIAMVLLGGLLLDAVTRNFATLISAYYRLIGLPEWVFGLIGSLIAICNWFVPAIAARVNRRCGTHGALAWGGVVVLLALALLLPAWRSLGIPAAMLLMMMLGYVSFTVSRFLHRVADSSQRATLISVKGLVFNLSYGLYSLIFSLLLAGLKSGDGGGFHQALIWQAGGFVVVLLIYVLMLRVMKSELK